MKLDTALHAALEAGPTKHAGRNDPETRAAFLASLRANGWVIAPREATEKMMRSACELDCPREICDAEGKCAHETRWKIYADTWRYMLAAAQGDDP